MSTNTLSSMLSFEKTISPHDEVGFFSSLVTSEIPHALLKNLLDKLPRINVDNLLSTILKQNEKWDSLGLQKDLRFFYGNTKDLSDYIHKIISYNLSYTYTIPDIKKSDYINSSLVNSLFVKNPSEDSIQNFVRSALNAEEGKDITTSFPVFFSFFTNALKHFDVKSFIDFCILLWIQNNKILPFFDSLNNVKGFFLSSVPLRYPSNYLPTYQNFYPFNLVPAINPIRTDVISFSSNNWSSNDHSLVHDSNPRTIFSLSAAFLFYYKRHHELFVYYNSTNHNRLIISVKEILQKAQMEIEDIKVLPADQQNFVHKSLTWI